MTSAPFLLQIPVLPTEREQLLSQQKGVSRSGILAQHFLNLTDHQIITSQPAHILYDHRPDLPGFDSIHHADKSRAVKPCAGYAIIRKMDIWGKSMGFCIF